MREIKFRAYSPEDKKMSADFTLYEVSTAGNKTILPFGIVVNGDTVLMQYIGLKDKNGKEIYEGDIVEVLGENYVVSYNKENVCYEVWLDGLYNSKEATPIHLRGCRVIGNIYENPELLKEKGE